MRLLSTLLLAAAILSAEAVDYKVLATTKTSTMEKELNDAAAAGFAFASVMGGETAGGGNEVVVVMAKSGGGKRQYKLLATSKTSTMEKELNEAGMEGFEFKGQTVFESTFGGREVGVILERDTSKPARKIRYKVQATSRTSTMEKELKQIGADGFMLHGLTVAKTRFGGSELLCILSKSE